MHAYADIQSTKNNYIAIHHLILLNHCLRYSSVSSIGCGYSLLNINYKYFLKYFFIE